MPDTVWNGITMGKKVADYANTYDKVVVFPNFGVDGATAGAKTYYIDDISFGVIMPPSNLDTTIKKVIHGVYKLDNQLMLSLNTEELFNIEEN